MLPIAHNVLLRLPGRFARHQLRLALLAVLLATFGFISPSLAQNAPDLLVDVLHISTDGGNTVDPYPRVRGLTAPVTIQARVRNSGNGAATATTLRYFISGDSTITTADDPLATAIRVNAGQYTGMPIKSIEGLAPGASSTQVDTVLMRAESRLAWIGACVDTVDDETAVANNCSQGARIEISLPDLTATIKTVGNPVPVVGESITLHPEVENLGSKSSDPTNVRYYRSGDRTIDTTDTELAVHKINGITAGRRTTALFDHAGSDVGSLQLTVPMPTAGTFWFGVCVDRTRSYESPELEATTDNNCSTGVKVTAAVVPPPDLTVDNVSVADTTPEAGTRFTINATVRNSGNGAAPGSRLNYYRSADNTVTTADTRVGVDVVSELEPGGSAAKNFSVAIANSGTWWIGACVDTVNRESNNNNNCSAGVQITVTPALVSGPDLTVDSVSVADATPEAGATFTINAIAWNRGIVASDATTLHYYRSTDRTISTADTEVATDRVSWLSAGGFSAENAQVFIADTGIYFVGACVAAVSGENTTNNCSAGVQITVTPALVSGPDLTVDNVSVADTFPQAGTTFTINATARNSGNGASVATTLHYYRSTDHTISTADTEVATDQVSQLSAGGFSAENVQVSITNTGIYFVGACVGAVNGETTTTNNCSAGVKITVTRAAAPDLTVDNVSVSDTTPEVGAPFTIIATVRNSGYKISPGRTLRYYRSTDSTITTDDTELATDWVGRLVPSASGSEDTLVSIANTGTWWIGACIDRAVGETETGNNCSDGVEVSVTVPPVVVPSRPDLTVHNVNVTDATVQTGVAFTINATARNSGNGASAATTLRYYRSTDDTITTDDSEFTTDSVSALAAGGSSQESAEVSIANSGNWWVGVCIDTVADEVARTNNCSTGVPVSVTAPPAVVPARPDLAVDTTSVSDTSVETDVSFTINATARNSGDGASAATTLRYYRSTNNTITTSDSELTTDSISALAAGGSSQENAVVSIANTGNWWVGACVDTVAGEVTRANNCSDGVEVSVTAPPVVVPPRSDLTVDTASVSDTSVQTRVFFTINATARNSGNGASPATMLRYYRSTDSAITKDDSELATDPISALAAGGSSQENAEVSIVNTGSYWVGACVDRMEGEAATDNNCSDGVPVSITAPPVVVPTRPDLTVDTVSVADATPETGASFTINATARNSGKGASAATTLRYYRSTSSTITKDDSELTTDTVRALAAGGFSSENAVVSIANTGNYWIGACVDTVANEIARTNNCSTGVPVSVTVPPVVVPTRPDLAVDTVSVAETSVETGVAFTINATARNSGNGVSAATTLRYYRSTDDTITTDDSELTTDPISALAAGGFSLENAVVSIANTGNYWVGACVDTVADEVARTNNCSDGVQVTVTAPPVAVPTLPDLAVDTISVSDASVETGVAFTINATARNSGDGVSAATTLRYYRSTDNTITTDDNELTTASISALAAGGFSSENAVVSIANTGEYWVGACVDTVADETEIGNNCSTGVSISVAVPPPAGNNGTAAVPAILRLLLDP